MPEGNSITIDTPQRKLRISISEPVIPCRTKESDPEGWFRIHPELYRLARGKLILGVSRDTDCPDEERLIFESTDEGRTWNETLHWPSSDTRGQHLGSVHALLPDGESLVVYDRGFFPAGEENVYVLPTWRSTDGGETWGEVEGARVEFTPGQPMDLYDPPAWYVEKYPSHLKRRKPEPPPALRKLRERFAPERLTLNLIDTLVLESGRVLLFGYYRGDNGKHVTVCLASDDRGRNWTHLSTPGRWEDRFNTENFLAHKTDGLCEPSVTQLDNGDLLLVMRLGSRHPLYATTSSDGGESWTSPRPLPVYGILPELVRLGDGTLCMASGRPDITLSVSLDQGYRWPLAYRFLEDGKPEDASTRNNTMLKLGPQRLLYMFDHGGYHQLARPGLTGERRIEGYFIDVEYTG